MLYPVEAMALPLKTAKSISAMNLSALVVFMATVSPLHAQVQPAPLPPSNFEVASVKIVPPHSLDDLVRGIGVLSISPLPANRLTFRNAPLGILIAFAYKADSYQIEARPGSLDSHEYDVIAKAEGDRALTRDEMAPLLQHLLEQRFHLAAHWESRTVPGYELVVAKGGAKLQPAKEGVHPYGQILPDGIQASGYGLDSLAAILHSPTGRPVVNKTGITGTYDIKLDYAPRNDPNSTLPDLFTALQEQLGLKLVSQKVPAQILVIDHVDQTPTDN
jgi:uncharacterized protein (TIGR03435 family)